MSELYQNKINLVKAFQWNGTKDQLYRHGFDDASFTITNRHHQLQLEIYSELTDTDQIGQIGDWVVDTPFDGNRIFDQEAFFQRYEIDRKQK